MKTKEIYKFLTTLVANLQLKAKAEDEKEKLPEEIKEHTRGQLYEAGYILENVEQIIFKD